MYSVLSLSASSAIPLIESKNKEETRKWEQDKSKTLRKAVIVVVVFYFLYLTPPLWWTLVGLLCCCLYDAAAAAAVAANNVGVDAGPEHMKRLRTHERITERFRSLDVVRLRTHSLRAPRLGCTSFSYIFFFLLPLFLLKKQQDRLRVVVVAFPPWTLNIAVVVVENLSSINLSIKICGDGGYAV